MINPDEPRYRGRDPDRWYSGRAIRGSYVVTLHEWGHAKPLPLRLEVMNHSPTGFAWGYSGSGPAQLTLAILVDTGVGAEDAIRLHQEFKEERIAPLDGDSDWEMSCNNVRAWVIRREHDLDNPEG